MQESLITIPNSQIAQKNADPDPEAAILARVYALILTWSLEVKTASGQDAEKNSAKSGTAGNDLATEDSEMAP
jgi:hypothetical protein